MAEIIKPTRTEVLEKIIDENGLKVEISGQFEGSTSFTILVTERLDNIDLSQMLGIKVGDGLVLKMPNIHGVKHPYFINMAGEPGADWSVENETEVDQRQRGKGIMPGALGLAYYNPETRTLFLDPDTEGVIPCQVMPYYPEETKFTVAAKVLTGQEKKLVMEQAIKAVMAHKVPMSEEFKPDYEGPLGIKRMTETTLDRAGGWYEKSPAPDEEKVLAARAEEFLKTALELALDELEFQKLIAHEVLQQGFYEQHGDARLTDNANIVTTASGGKQVVMRDAVRLVVRPDTEVEVAEPKLTDFHLTSDYYQFGLAMAGLLVRGEIDLVKAGMEAFQALKQVEPEIYWAQQKLIGFGLAYGLCVEILVARGMIGKADYQGPSIQEYWQTMLQVIDGDMLGWTKMIVGENNG